MLHAHARRTARRDANGAYVPLAQQDPALWDTTLIDEAERLLHQASALRAIGRFQLEAAVQSAHVIRRFTGQTDWPAVAQLYGAVAVAECEGAARGLEILDSVADDPRLANYQPYWAARAHLLARSGATDAADAAYAQAIGLELDPAVRRYLQQQRETLKPTSL